MTCTCKHEFCYQCGETWDTVAGVRSTGCELFEHNRLLDAAERRAVANVPRNNINYEEELRRQMHNLENHEDCAHRFESAYSGDMTCGTCAWTADQYIYRCRHCDTNKCGRCRRNRAEGATGEFRCY